MGQTCPPLSSFDAKSELQRVLRDHPLPPDYDPNNPKNFFSKAIARLGASLTSVSLKLNLKEVEVESWSIAGAAFFIHVEIPKSKKVWSWWGCLGTWQYLGSCDLNQDYGVVMPSEILN